MNSLISVIVPIFKVEEYLSRCVDSIVNQTYKNLEIILVNDGSPDRCPQICDEYEKMDNRIRVVHKKNGGLSDARNAGIKIATGDYISFIDSDDYIAQDFFEILLQTMQLENSDIVECSVVKFYEDNHFDQYSDDNIINSYTKKEGLSSLILEKQFKQHVWNKLYKSYLVFDVPFEVGKTNEDEFWSYQIFAKANIVTRINKTMYYYFQRASSIMGNRYSINRLDGIEAKSIRQRFISQNFPDMILISKINYYNSCMYSYQCSLKYLKKNDKAVARKKILGYLQESRLSWKELFKLRLLCSKWHILAKISFRLCCVIRNVFNVGF